MGLDWHTFAYLGSDDLEKKRDPLPEVIAAALLPQASMYYRGKYAVAILRTFLGDDATQFCFGEQINDNYFLTENQIRILITYFTKINEILKGCDPTDTIGKIHNGTFQAKEDEWFCLDGKEEVEEISRDVSEILQYLQVAKKGYNGIEANLPGSKFNGLTLYTRVWAWW